MPKVMIVDDAAYARLKSARLLAANGFQVISVESGAEAVQHYRTQHPDAVLLDVTLPDKDGLHVLQDIKAVDPNARVVMVTALAHQSIVAAALKAGARDFIEKPFSQEKLLAAVQRVLN